MGKSRFFLQKTTLRFSIELEQKVYENDPFGGREVYWKPLGKHWAHIEPARARYPVVYEDQKHYRGAVYDVIMQEHPDVYQADKIIWHKPEMYHLDDCEESHHPYLKEHSQDLFYLHSPQMNKKRIPGRISYVQIRVFAWEKLSTPVHKEH